MEIAFHDIEKIAVLKDGLICLPKTQTEQPPAKDDPMPVEKPLRLIKHITFKIRSDLKNDYYSYGMPLPKDWANNIDRLCLYDNDDGSKIDAQFNVTARHPDQSIRSLLITAQFIGGKTYRLVKTLRKTLTQEVMEINDNLVFAEEYKIKIVKSKLGAILISDHNDSILRTEFFLDAIKSKDYPAPYARNLSQELTTETKVIYNGPIMCELEVTQAQIDRPTLIWNYRFYRYANKIDASLTVKDDRPQPSNNSFNFEKDEVEFAVHNLRLHVRATGNMNNAAFGGDNYEVITDAKDLRLNQFGARNINQYGVFSLDPDAKRDDETGQYEYFNGADEGDRATGFAVANFETLDVSILNKNFWQEWPRYFSAQNNELVLGFFPKIESPKLNFSVSSSGYLEPPNVIYHQRAGFQKSYEFQIRFGRNMINRDIAQIKTSYDNEAPIFEPLSHSYHDLEAHYAGVSDELSKNYDEGLRDNMLLIAKKAYPARSSATGWRDYGDQMRPGFTAVVPSRFAGWYNDSHIGSIKKAIQFMRSGDLVWWEECVKRTRHFMDIDVSHSPIHNRIKREGYNPIPAGMPKLIGHGNLDHDGRNLHAGHIHASGLIHYYMMTGDTRAHRVLMEIRGYLEHTAPYYYPLPRPAKYEAANRAYAEAERDFGWPLDVMNQITTITGDREFHVETAGRLVQFLVDWWKTGGNHIINDEVVKTCDWKRGTGYLLMDSMDNSKGGLFSNGCNPWMLGPILTAVLNWLELDGNFIQGPSIDHSLVKNMLFQLMNHAIVHGYEKSLNNFVYSEARRIPDRNGARMLISPFIRLYLMLIDEPELMPDSVNIGQWHDVLAYQANKLVTEIKKMQATGDYGYEAYYDGRFFPLYPKFLALSSNQPKPPIVILPDTQKVKLSISSDNIPSDSFLFETGAKFDIGATLEISREAEPKGNVIVDSQAVVKIDAQTPDSYRFQYRLYNDETMELPDFKVSTFHLYSDSELS